MSAVWPWPLELDGDDLVVLGQGGEDRPPEVDRAKERRGAGQRLAAAVDP
jgi:hypothetical protein